MSVTKNYEWTRLLKEKYYSSECLVLDKDRISYISSRLKRKKIFFYLKIWEDFSARNSKRGNNKTIKIDKEINLKVLVEQTLENYNNVLKNGGCIEIITKNNDWCICHVESIGAFFCSRILEKLNIKIQENEEDAKLSDEVPGWIEILSITE